MHRAVAETITVYAYHNVPPLVINNEKGISFDLVDALNRYTKGNPGFKLMVVPRTRLNELIRRPDFNAVVTEATPEWFNDQNRSRHLWTDVYLEDRDVILSNPNKPLDFTGIADFKGKVFSGITGHNYTEIDQLANDGLMERQNVSNERANLLKLAAAQIDFTILPLSTANYMLNDLALKDKIYIARNPYHVFAMRMLVPRNQPGVHKLLNDAIATLTTDAQWQATLTKYKMSER